MAYPPDFSSTETYANQYDLDEIDVFLEGNSTNPMYFLVTGINKQFSFGKHYFNLSILDSKNQEHRLRENSRILFEFKSINNVVIKSDIIKQNQRNGVISGFFEILRDPKRTYKEIRDGEGTLTIVGSLENKSTTKNLIPNKFLKAMNYRCTFPVDIRKNLINADSPLTLQSEHKIQTSLGRFSFTNGSISTAANSTSGNTYDTTGVPSGNPPTKGGSTS